MSDFKVGDYVYDSLINEVVVYDDFYDYMCDAHKEMVLRHATPKEIEEIKAIDNMENVLIKQPDGTTLFFKHCNF